MLFCNIGWMSRYQGLVGQPDKIVGGGKWVTENQAGGEVCNFVICSDGYVYGHVETSQGEKDRKIRIEAVGGTDDFVEGVDVIWTATDPNEGGRKIVGWYRNATVFRERQQFDKPPSRQHARDNIESFRICALAKDVHSLDLDDRTVVLGRGPGWMGHTPWWVPSDSSPPEVRRFARRVHELLDGLSGPHGRLPQGSNPERKSPGAASGPYPRYVEAHEVSITPRHSALQARFERFVAANGATQLQPNVASVDLRFHDANKGTVLAEIKPCEAENVRYAIRTAMGQLLDYRQRAEGKLALLVVLEVEPNDEDRLLAISNGFGIAYPVRAAFDLCWPTNMKIG